LIVLSDFNKLLEENCPLSDIIKYFEENQANNGNFSLYYEYINTLKEHEDILRLIRQKAESELRDHNIKIFMNKILEKELVNTPK
jgi:hypothetical protein